MVRCARYLEIIEEDNLVENAAQVGAYLLQELRQVQSEFPVVTNTRGRGLLIAFDMPDGATRAELRARCWDAGLATLACGPRSIRFRPALTFSEADADRAVAILQGALARPAVAEAENAETDVLAGARDES
jgi:L-lysine 6-transaminase